MIAVYNGHSYLKSHVLQTTDGAWIAGGFVRSLISGETPRDIDVFFKDNEALLHFVRANRLEVCYDHKRRLFTSSKDGHKIDLVDFMYFRDVIELLNSFDFRMCQVALSGFYELWANPKGLQDIKDKKLVIQEKYDLEQEPIKLYRTISRIRKFVKRGYVMDSLELKKILDVIPESMKFRNMDFSETYAW